MCDDVKKCIHIVLQKNLYHILKEIMIMNNKYQIYILGLNNK